MLKFTCRFSALSFIPLLWLIAENNRPQKGAGYQLGKEYILTVRQLSNSYKVQEGMDELRRNQTFYSKACGRKDDHA